MAIQKDAGDGGVAQVKWDAIWDNTLNNDSAKSISLTFEVEDGAVVPYVYVTGTSVISQTLSDIATLRYRGKSGDKVWEQIYTTGNIAAGLDVIGAGYGNAYVIGRSENNLFVIGYRRDGTERLGPSIYNNGGFDEGRVGVMVGAGALVAAGASAGTSLLDFVSQKFAQTVWTTNPSSYTVAFGE